MEWFKTNVRQRNTGSLSFSIAVLLVLLFTRKGDVGKSCRNGRATLVFLYVLPFLHLMQTIETYPVTEVLIFLLRLNL